MKALSALNAVQTLETVDFTVLHPNTNEPLMILVMRGHTHPERKKLAAKYSQQLSQAFMRANDPKKVMQKQYAQMGDAEESFEKEVELLMAATDGWKDADGGPSDEPYDASAMEATYRLRDGPEDKEWLRKQVLSFLGAEGSFTKSSQSKSSSTASASSSLAASA